MNYRVKCLWAVLILAVFSLSACGRDSEPEKQAATPEKQAAAPEKQATEAVKPEVAPAQPGQAPKRTRYSPPPPPKILPVKGKVLEIIDTGNFLFVSLDWEGKKVWATVPGVELKLGEVVALDHAAMIKSFRSETLNRTFDNLIFASGVIGKQPRPRMANNAKLKDPKARRSGQFVGSMPLRPAPPLPVPKQPAANPGAPAAH